MIAIQDSVDMLRGRFLRLKTGKGDFQSLATQIGVSHSVLKKFVRGEDTTQEPLRKIEAWCNTQEKADVSHQ